MNNLNLVQMKTMMTMMKRQFLRCEHSDNCQLNPLGDGGDVVEGHDEVADNETQNVEELKQKIK